MVRASNGFNPESRQAKRQAIIAALARSSGEATGPADADAGENGSYYTMTHDQMEALLNGNIEKIESWVSSLDRKHATWLLRWLITENG